MENKTKIILNRKQEWINRARSFKVYIDGSEVGRIRNDSAEEFSISPGEHVVQCKVDWCTSRTVTINLRQDEKAYLKVQSGMKYYLYLVIPLFIGVLLNLVWRTQGVAAKPAWFYIVQTMLILPALCYLFYYVTFGRKQYLLLEADKDNLFA
ncbi:MAG: hypothetical protein QM731_13605 [Chitinophagaceae bacterium]